jgi:Ni,Fe-hydrogenase III small subunit
MPEPKWVLAVGDCGACGGIFGANYATRRPLSAVIPVHAVVNGCPPSPLAILQGLLHITRHLAL